MGMRADMIFSHEKVMFETLHSFDTRSPFIWTHECILRGRGPSDVFWCMMSSAVVAAVPQAPRHETCPLCHHVPLQSPLGRSCCLETNSDWWGTNTYLPASRLCVHLELTVALRVSSPVDITAVPHSDTRRTIGRLLCSTTQPTCYPVVRSTTRPLVSCGKKCGTTPSWLSASCDGPSGTQ